MPIVIFDLDKTLITGDSDFLWGEFIHKAEIVDADYRKTNYFYEQYEAGEQDNIVFLKFFLEPLRHYSRSKLDDFHQQYMKHKIEPTLM